MSPPYDLYRARTPDGGQVLITVWPDGTGTVAYRSDEWSTWGPPEPMEHFEGAPVHDCGHCLDDPPAGHTCPRCGRVTPVTGGD